MNHLENEIINILGYIDDLVLWNQNANQLVTQVWRSVALLEGLDLTVSREKSCPSPTSSLT